MGQRYHKDEPLESRHPPINWTVADAAERAALTGLDVYGNPRIGGIAWQQDNDSLWYLVSTAPAVWTQITIVNQPFDPATLSAGEYRSLDAPEVVTVAENTVGAGAVLSVSDADGGYYMANASTDADAQTADLCLALEDGVGAKIVTRECYYRKAGWTWTPGGALWIDTTDGVIVQSIPAAPAYVKCIGRAVSADTIYFRPQGALVKKVSDV
jgi:hypothetical protein